MSTDNAYDRIIIGAGCAGLSLAKDNPEGMATLLIDPSPRRQDHSWGFFATDELTAAQSMARKIWHQWAIITPQGKTVQHSSRFPYAGIESKAWLTHCRNQGQSKGVMHLSASVKEISDDYAMTADHGAIKAGQIFDSRPPAIPEGMMIQHFIGHEVEADKPVFDPQCAILMDFRCDQSRGIHFIYVLPYTDKRALVESTMFSPKLEDDGFYETAIADYLRDHFKVSSAMVLRRERGAIPMGVVGKVANPQTASVIPIGGAGGAIRPSSGYAFAFIQRQIALIQNNAATTSPHQPIDLWMDRVFLNVIANRPKLAPKIFSTIGKALSGDEMALFMSGQASNAIRMKVILAMPKFPFIKAAIAQFFRRRL